MKVKVADGYQVNENGKIREQGDTVDLPDGEARRLLLAGVVEVIAPRTRKTSEA